jgi:hypothetical protein
MFGLGIGGSGLITILNPVAAIYGGQIGLLITRILIGVCMVRCANIKLNNFAKFERASKYCPRNFFLAISGLVNQHFFNN